MMRAAGAVVEEGRMPDLEERARGRAFETDNPTL